MGCGALGCEYLKGLSLMGVALMPRGPDGLALRPIVVEGIPPPDHQKPTSLGGNQQVHQGSAREATWLSGDFGGSVDTFWLKQRGVSELEPQNSGTFAEWSTATKWLDGFRTLGHDQTTSSFTFGWDGHQPSG